MRALWKRAVHFRVAERGEFMNVIASAAIPCLLAIVFFSSFVRKTPVFDAFVSGAKEGLKTMAGIFPALLALITAVEVMNASGLTDGLTAFFTPIFTRAGIPPEITPLILLRPVSGSGSTAVLKDIFDRFGADSFAARCAAVIAGGTETTFYTLTVYFAASHVKDMRHSIVCAVAADIVCVLCGCTICRFFFG